MKKYIKKAKKIINNLAKDKLNIAIGILIILVTILGISVVGVIKTFLIFIAVIALVLGLRFGGLSLMSKKKNKGKKIPKKWRKIINLAIIIGLCAGIAIVTLGILLLGYIVLSAPKFDKQKLLYKEASIIYDINNKEVTRVGDEMRDKVTYDEIPQVFIDAIVATEDSRYFEHNGFDLPRFLKASTGQVLGNSGAGGASTISMQVVKNNFTSTNQSIIRKFTDIYLAVFKLEKTYTKEQILEFYVNDIHLGVNNTLGIAETSRALFGKEISDINLSQAALLAGMFQAPGAYNPYLNPVSAASRRSTVLYLMERHGYITKDERLIADSMPIKNIIATKTTKQHPYQSYIDYVLKEVKTKTSYDPMIVPMKIYTNLDTTKQDHLNDVLNGVKFNWENSVVQSGIAVTDINTGAVVALGGGRNRNGAKTYNLATDISRQVGSTAKPIFDYGPGMEFNNWSTYNPFVDDVYSYTGGKNMSDWDGAYFGMMTLRNALAQSRNVPALKAFQQIDNKKVLEFVQALGITPEVEDGRIHEAHAIGAFNGTSPLQLAAAYAAFGNGGYYIAPYAVNKIEIIETEKVTTYKPEKVKVMSDSTAYMITNILKYGVDNGMIGGGRVSGVDVAAKSGTSNYDDKTKAYYKMSAIAINDLWFAGYSPEYSIGMWYGYEKTSAEYYSRLNITSVIRNRLFTAIANGIFTKTGKKFEMPSSVIPVTIENGTIPAMLPSANTPSNFLITEYFKKGTEPTEVSPRFNTLPSVTNLDATEEGSNVKLTWNAVSAPDMMTPEYLATIAAQKDKYINQRRSQDASVLGTLGYNVYLKKTNGDLTLLGWTSNTTFTHKPIISGSLSYVVKTCYSTFKASQSSGTTITLSSNPYSSNIQVKLSGDSSISMKQGTTYNDAGIKVTDNSIDVTNDATVSITIYKGLAIVRTISSGSLTELNSYISTAAIGLYTVKYNVTYGGESDNVSRLINITT